MIDALTCACYSRVLYVDPLHMISIRIHRWYPFTFGDSFSYYIYYLRKINKQVMPTETVNSFLT